MKTTRRNLLVIGVFAGLLPFWAAGTEAATVMPGTGTASAVTTGFDRTIDLIVQQRVAAEKLSPADALVAREQLQIQFLSLTKTEQQTLLVAARSLGSEESVQAVRKMLNDAVQESARTALADVQAAARAQLATSQAQGMTQKLGADGDLVFVATVGPCRVFDSRFGPGPLAGFAARQIWGYSDNPFYLWSFDQGGTGQAGSGNCAGTVYGGSVRPVSVVATVAVVNTLSTGSMRAWNGGTTLTVGGVLGWTAGSLISNTTVIPMDRFIAAYPASGAKRDFGLYNNSPNAVDIVVDVVGYFIENQATPLDCTRILDSDFSLGAGLSTLRTAPACPTGYTPMTGMPATNQFGVYTGSFFENQCRINNTTGATVNNLRCDAYCCRIPGR